MTNTRGHVQSEFGPFAGSTTAAREDSRHSDITVQPDRHPRIRDVQWSLVYVAFLVYIFVVVTYRVPLGDIAVATALVGLLAQKGVRTPAFFGWLGTFVLWCLFGYAQTLYPGEVWESVIVMGKIWLICLVAFNALRTSAQVRFFMIFFLCCFACYPARGAIFNYVFGGYTLVGRAIWNYAYANPNDLAALIFWPLSMAAALFVTDQSHWIKRGAMASLFVLPLLILMTQSRGGALGLLVFGALAIVGHRRRLRVLILGVPLAALALMFAPAGVWDRFEQTNLSGAASSEDIADRMAASSTEQRWAILQTAAAVANDHPAFGVGFGAYPLAHAAYAPEMGTKSAHNTYLQVAAETGFPGLLIFIGLLGTTFYRAERARKLCKAAMRDASLQIWYLEVGLIAYLVAGIFGSFAELAFLYLHLAFIWALADVAVRQVRRARGLEGTVHANTA